MFPRGLHEPPKSSGTRDYNELKYFLSSCSSRSWVSHTLEHGRGVESSKDFALQTSVREIPYRHKVKAILHLGTSVLDYASSS